MTALDKAERQWEEQGPTSYRIEVLVGHSIWHAQYHTITVQDGAVVDETARCVPAPFEGRTCEVEPFNAEDFTVSSLFAQARNELNLREPEFVHITFDPTYGYPEIYNYDHPDIFDEDWGWAVTSFEAITP